MFLEPCIDKQLVTDADPATVTWHIGRMANSIAQSSIDRYVDIEKLMTQNDDLALLVKNIGFVATYVSPALAEASRGFALTLRPNIENDAVVIGHELQTFCVDRLEGNVLSKQSFVSDYYGGAPAKKRWLDSIKDRMPPAMQLATYGMLRKIAEADRDSMPPLDGPTIWAMIDREETVYGLDDIEPFEFGELDQNEDYTRWISSCADTTDIDITPTSIGKISVIDGYEYALVTSLRRENMDVVAERPEFVKRVAGCWTAIDDNEEYRLSRTVIRRGTEVSSIHAEGILNELESNQQQLHTEVLLDSIDDISDNDL